MIVLGIVGSPAGGKSTVAGFLQEKGAVWINADAIARDVLHQPDVQRQLVEYFGPTIIDDQGKPLRAEIASRVFGHEPEKLAALAFLESIVHPLTRAEITRQLERAAKQGARVAILDVPLMFESGWDLSCDQIWCIDSPRAQRQQRAAARGWDEGELSRREANQPPIELKSRLSNVLVWNDSTLDSLREKIEKAWRKLVTMEASARAVGDKHCLTDA